MLTVQFVHGQDGRESKVFGPYAFVQLTYNSLRVGNQEADEVIGSTNDENWWITQEDGQQWSDVVINQWR